MFNILVILTLFGIVFLLSYFATQKQILAPWILAFAPGIHLITLVIIYKTGFFTASDMTIIAAWKEFLVFSLGFWLIIYWIKRGNIYRIKLTTIDKWVLVYLLFNVVYIAYSFFASPFHASAAAILNGFRLQTMFLFTFFVARMAYSKRNLNVKAFLRTIIFFGTIVSVVAILELFFSPAKILSLIDVKKYLIDVAGMYEGEFSPEGLVATYFSHYNSVSGGGVRFRRAGSLLLSPLAFGQVLIITIPIAFLLSNKRYCSKFHVALQFIGIVCSLSRGPIIGVIGACASILFVKSIISSKTKKQLSFLILIFSLLLVVKGFSFIQATLTLKDSSAYMRVIAWTSSIEFMKNFPLGAGLAASNSKFSKEKFGGGESELFEIGSKIGITGLLLYFFVFIVILKKSREIANSNLQLISILSVIVWATTMGLSLQSVVNSIWRHPFIPFVYGWILGVWVSEVAKIQDQPTNSIPYYSNVEKSYSA